MSVYRDGNIRAEGREHAIFIVAGHKSSPVLVWTMRLNDHVTNVG
jgi:hypothetical protein